MSETQTYWHIAYDAYQPGESLKCREMLDAHDVETPWKWGDDAPEGFDANVVCLFPDTPRGRTEADWFWYDYPTYHLLRVEVPVDLAYLVETVEEGYPAFPREIPAEWITSIRTGYTEGIVRQPGDEY